MVTKRQLGFVVVALSATGIIGVFTVDILGAGEWGGFGPLQRLAAALGIAGAIVGAVLIGLGDRPA